MGLLDDAIREHLELKRRHGADPGEVARQEREALGAPRSPVAPPEEDVAPVDGVPSDSVPAAPPPEPDAIPEPPVVPEPEAGGAVSIDRFAPEPEPDIDWSQPEPEPPRGAEPPAEPAAEGQDGDVLDQTPDFLQETPEHDRLWFEQKPPRDFDF